MKKIFLYASIGIAGGLFLLNVYNSLIDARSWGSDIPSSIAAAREYYKNVNPGDFYRIFSPLNQILALLVLILFWRSSSSVRLTLGIAFVFYVLADVMTFAYFYPRNEIMFMSASLTDVVTLKQVWSEWDGMNWLRSLIVLAGLFFSCLSLHKIYKLK